MYCIYIGGLGPVAGVDGSVGQPKASKPWLAEVQGSTPGMPDKNCSSCFSLVFIKNLINDKSKHKKKNVTIFLYCPGLLTVIYNIYNSITS